MLLNNGLMMKNQDKKNWLDAKLMAPFLLIPLVLLGHRIQSPLPELNPGPGPTR